MEAEQIAERVQEVAGTELLAVIRKEIHEAGHTDVKDAVRLSAEVLRILAQRHGCTWLLPALFPPDQQTFFRNLVLLSELLPSLQFLASDIESLHHAIPPEVFQDGAIGQYLDAVRAWTGSYPEEAARLAERVLLDARLRILATPVLQGLGVASAKMGFDPARLADIERRCRAAGPDLLAATVYAIPSQVFNDVAELDTVLDELAELLDGARPEVVAAAAVNAVSMLWDVRGERPRLRRLLLDAKADSRPLVRLAIATALGRAWATEDPDDVNLVRNLVPALADIDEEHHRIVYQVSWLLYSMAKKDPEAVLGFLRLWATRGREGLPLWHSKRFLHLLPALPRDVFTSTLIRWLIDDRRLEEIAAHILTFELHVEALLPNQISALSGKELRILILVLAALDHSHGTARLLVSLFQPLEARSDAEEFREEIERALVHAVANFPSLVDLLPGETEIGRSSFASVASRLRSYRDEVGNARRLAAGLTELACPADRLSLYRRIEGESTAEAMREATSDDPGRTPFLALAKRVNMLAGGQFFSRIGGRFTTPTRLMRLTTTVEIAQLPLLDPTAETIRMAQLQARIDVLRRGDAE